MDGTLQLTRRVGMLEGASFLLLLGAAMPLKYMLGMPLAVRIVGSAHGVLFIAYVLLAAHAVLRGRISRTLGLKMVIASLLPAGPFFVDRDLQAIATADAPGQAALGAGD
jgi:integral membrane protein